MSSSTLRPLVSRLRIEPLELRIAPAVFFLSGSSLSVVDKDGTSVNRGANASIAGADMGVLLAKGDSLVLDQNGNHVFDAFDPSDPGTPGDLTLITVKAGSAVVFAKDFNTDTKFEVTELSGIAVSDGFSGQVNVDVNGGIVTSLDDADLFTGGTIQNASISGLIVKGRVAGDIFAGGSISNVTIGSALWISGGTSVTNIKTGKATDGGLIALGGALMTTFTPAAGAAGPSITGVTLTSGALQIIAGDGADSMTANGGAGGSISKLTITSGLNQTTVKAGDGGDTSATDFAGGAGGTLSGLNITLAAPGVTNTLLGGNGGSSTTDGNGGAGGSISTSSIHTLTSTSTVTLLGGSGGNATGSGVAGAGGAVTGSKMLIDGGGSTLSAMGGNGGSGTGGNATGGAGGSNQVL